MNRVEETNDRMTPAAPASYLHRGVSIWFNLGGSIGTTLASVLRGGNPSMDAFRGIFVLDAAGAHLDMAIATPLAA